MPAWRTQAWQWHNEGAKACVCSKPESAVNTSLRLDWFCPQLHIADADIAKVLQSTSGTEDTEGTGCNASTLTCRRDASYIPSMASGASDSNRYVQVNQHILEQRRIQQTAESRWLADTSEGAKIVTGSFSRTSLSLCFWCWKQCSWFQSFKARPESENHFDVLGFQMDQVWRTGFQSFCISVGSTANGLARTSLSGGLPQFLLEASWPSNVPAMTTIEAKTLASRAQQLSCVYTPENQHEIWKLTPQGGGFFF